MTLAGIMWMATADFTGRSKLSRCPAAPLARLQGSAD